jgi:hypothetical protein
MVGRISFRSRQESTRRQFPGREESKEFANADRRGAAQSGARMTRATGW